MINSNLYQSHTWAIFASTHRFLDIHISKFVTLKRSCRDLWRGPVIQLPGGMLRSWRRTYAVAPFDCKYQTSYLMAIVMFALSATIFEIFTNQEKGQNCYLENEGQGQGVEILDLRRSTRNVRIHIGDFFRIFATWQRTFTQQDAHTDTHKHSERQRWWLWAKSAKQICLKMENSLLCDMGIIVPSVPSPSTPRYFSYFRYFSYSIP